MIVKRLAVTIMAAAFVFVAPLCAQNIQKQYEKYSAFLGQDQFSMEQELSAYKVGMSGGTFIYNDSDVAFSFLYNQRKAVSVTLVAKFSSFTIIRDKYSSAYQSLGKMWGFGGQDTSTADAMSYVWEVKSETGKLDTVTLRASKKEVNGFFILEILHSRE